jgi:hypothetical protein
VSSITALRWFAIPCVAIFLSAANVMAKRIPAKPVLPIISSGIRYSAESDRQDQYVTATDTANGNVLWKVKVFHNRINFWREIDVQFVYIADLKLVANSLLVRDEKARCYSVDLASKHVKHQRCSG